MMRKTQLFLFLFISVSISSAQTSDEIFQKIKKLNTLGSVLYIAAHPDDENTRLLTWLANERHLRTGYISLTRGDGGQNLIGKEQGDALGLIRTHELLAARSIDHAEQYFTRANDFGYSKTPEETFEIWNKESVLSDLVWVIRQFKPDILITRFPTTGEGGHGHHTASAILALEAFHAAADPERFPEQLKKVAVWQARRIFWNTFNFGSTNTTSPDQFKIDIGNFNPLLGKSYGEIAAESRSMHKSQGFGTAMQRGSNFEYFKLLDGDNIATDLFEGIDLSWKKISGGDAIQSAINRCILSFDHEHPAESLPQLTKIYNEIKLLPCKAPEEIYWKEEKVKETEELLLDCSGLWIEGIASDYSISPGQPLTMNCQIIARNDSDILLEKITFPGKEDTTIQMTLKQNELYSFKHTGVLPVDIHYSNPYWLDKPHGTGLFNIEKQELVGKPINDSQVNVLFHLNVSGAEVKVMRPVTFKYTDPAKGEIYRPLEILPPAVVNFPEKVFVFDNGNSKTISLFI
ncbi:MAG: PIG-L family deacetylase, partial [Crocinitomicaceae bacterium]|nr:PIG-L family deacetylase [Crocinitomicaceae bacterium]